jgi:hypothetical protein
MQRGVRKAIGGASEGYGSLEGQEHLAVWSSAQRPWWTRSARQRQGKGSAGASGGASEESL